MRALFTFLIISLSLNVFAANRYWVAAAASNWNNTANWSTTSGGAGGASVPGAADVAIFNANGLGNCNLDIAPALGGITVNNYTGIIDLSGFVLSVTSGNSTMTTGTMNDTPGTGSFSINSTGTSNFNGTTFGAVVNCTSARVYLSGSTFNAAGTFVKNGAGNDAGQGGNTFGAATTISNTGTGYLMTGNVNPDTFNGVLTASNTGTSLIYLAHNSAGNLFNQNILLECTSGTGIRFCQGGGTPSATLAATMTLGLTGGGFTAGELRIYDFTSAGATAQNLTLTGTGRMIMDNATFGANITFTAPRIQTRDSNYGAVTILTKTGAGNDQSAGGNTFTGNLTLNNTGSNYLMMGNGNPDTYSANVTINNSGSNLVYLAYSSAGNTIAGNLTVNNSATATGVRISDQAASTLSITGNTTINLTGSADNTTIFGNAGDITNTGSLTMTNTSSAATSYFYVANNLNSVVQIDGTTTLTNSGTGATNSRAFIGENGDVTFNGNLDIINTSISGNSLMYFNRNANSTNTYNENITVQSTAVGCDGVQFGGNTGSGTLAANKTITIGIGGFVDGALYLRNFTQTGATAQALAPTGTTTFTIYDSNWGGNVDFSAPRITTRGTTYSGTCDMTKTGANNDNSVGGNNFIGDATFVNSGSGEMGMGNGTADTFGSDVDITNSGTSNFRLAYNSAGNTVAGNITALNTGTANNLYLSSATASTLAVTGNVSLTDNSTDADHDDYIGNNGDVTIGGDLTISNVSPGDRCDILVASGTDSQVSVAGTTNVTNNGTGATISRIWLGSNGDCTFNALNITNSTAATNSGVYLNYNANSNNLYNGNIVLVVDNAASDGIRFGENTGAGTLAAGLTVTVGGGGFIAGDLRFRNFTQIGGTAQNISCSSTARIYNYDSNWGGNIDFDAPRMLSRGTTYNGTADLEKTGALDDASAGGNTFVGNATIRNSGSNYFLMGNGSADDFQSDLDVINNGSDEIYIAYNSAGNTIGGNVTANMSGSSLRIDFCSQTASTLTVTGTATFSNSSNAVTNQMIFGNNGDIDFDSSVDITTTSAGTNSYVYVANGTTSTVSVDGTFDFTHGTTATGNTRSYLGNQGDITFNNVLTITNSSAGANSEIYCNHNVNSTNAYNHNIVVNETIAGGDGIRFGQGTGSGTLAATRTVTIGGGGFVSGDLQFRNFTQVGPTAQTLLATGTARIYNYDSNWGGDIDFAAPRILTRGTTYNLTTDLEKTGGVGDDGSVGGNTFVGNCTLTNSGSNYFMMGNGSPDDWQADLDVIINGTDEIYLCYNSAGNTIAGTFDVTMSNASDRVDVCSNANSSLTVTGATTANLNSTSVMNILYFGVNGDIDFDNSVLINNNSAGTTNRIVVANGTDSQVSIDGAFTFNHNSTATNDTRAYLGNQGDVTFNGLTTIVNATGPANSHIYCNHGANSSNSYNNDMVLSCTSPTSDGIYFGNGSGNGTLAATRTVTIGVGGFIAGDLQFRNFTQVGPTAQALTCTGTARIYNYDSNWGGDVNFVAPRMLTRGTTYNGISYLEKTSISNDQSPGGNTFVGNCELRHTGANQFLMGNGTADTWQANLIVNNLGTGYMYVGHAGAGHTIAGTLDWTHAGSSIQSYLANATGSTVDVTGNATFVNTSNVGSAVYVANNGTLTFGGTVQATNTPSGAVTGQIRFSEGTNGSITFGDDVTITNNGTSTTSNTYLGSAGDITLNGNLIGSNVGSGTNSNFYVANGTNCTAVINGSTTFSQSGNITTTRSYFGNQGDITFNGTLDISNNAQSNNSQVYLNYNANSSNAYNGNVTATSENASCDGVYFGDAGGIGTLSAGNTVSVGGGGFVAGDYRFRNFTQLGGTAQNIVCTGTARIYHRNSNWSGNIICTAPRFFTRETTYDGTADLTKNGASNDDSNGANTFNGVTTITNSGTGRMRLSATNTMVDDFNDDVTFVKSGTGALQPSYNNTDTYAGDININANAQIYFGQAGNGRVLFDGGAADQDINDLGASPIPLFRDFQVNKAAGEVNCNMEVEITVELDLDNGVVNTTTANLMYMRDNSTVSSVSDASHIDGPIEKIGNDAFTFPVGDSSLYRPIAMSAPASGAARFRAEYINDDPHPTYDHLSLAASIDHISSCEYWLLDRIASTNNVFVTLSWDTPTSCGVSTLPDLTVARWDGAVWQDEGNGATMGNATAGTVTSVAAVTNFSPFTLASTTLFNPLPVELVDFRAELNQDVVDLDWTTMSEIDNDYFEVQKSVDGENWNYLTTVEGAGNSNAQLDYHTVDENPIAGINYYRLKQVDFDGAFEYSDVVAVDIPFNNNGDLTVYPNPTNDLIYVIADEAELETIEIYNSVGQIIRPRFIFANGQAIVDLTDYEAGLYFVRTDYSIVRIVKQ